MLQWPGIPMGSKIARRIRGRKVNQGFFTTRLQFPVQVVWATGWEQLRGFNRGIMIASFLVVKALPLLLPTLGWGPVMFLCWEIRDVPMALLSLGLPGSRMQWRSRCCISKETTWGCVKKCDTALLPFKIQIECQGCRYRTSFSCPSGSLGQDRLCVAFYSHQQTCATNVNWSPCMNQLAEGSTLQIENGAKD